MTLMDWLIMLLPVAFILYMGYHARRYVRSVADFLSAGRLCGRYLICVADMTNALSIMGLVAYVEVHYRTGFSLAFWNKLTTPITIFMGLTGFCFYRFRETKAMSLGQFLEMRYSRAFRIFAAGLRSISEMLANMIMPAIGARFFIYFLGLPTTLKIPGFNLGGIAVPEWSIPTFMLLTFLILTIAISIICMGGTLALVITDSIQGMFCYPLLVLFAVFVLCKFNWNTEIVPVMQDRVAGENFLNPNDIAHMRDFNLFHTFVLLFTLVINRAVWIGAGNSTAAKTAHEQKMANLLGQWRGALSNVFYILIAVTIIVVLNHKNYAVSAKLIRDDIAVSVANDVIKNPADRANVIAATTAIPEQRHQIGIDPPLSDAKNLDTPYMEAARKALPKGAEGNAVYKQFRTLFKQMMMAMTMRRMLPPGMLGLFCLLLILAMISTDDTRIYSAALTISQDVILPFIKKDITPKQHLWLIRSVAIGVGVFFFFGSFFMAQLEYINLYISIMVSIWGGGAGAVMLFGLYSRFGTTAGAFTSLFSGMIISGGGMLIKRNWADHVYPWLVKMNWAEPLGNFLERVSRPFNPIIKWHMTPVDFPINSYEISFIAICISISLYVIVSKLTCKEPFNLERMLHRGKYAIDGEIKTQMKWTLRNVFSKLIGITPAYSKGDRIIAYTLFCYSIGYSFCLMFVVVLIWNAISPWQLNWWSNYFFISLLLIPCGIAAITAVWYGIGGFINLIQLFRDLKQRVINPLDNGRVEGNMSLADKAQLEAADKAQLEAAGKK
ncbi:MAG: sodium:panthothenate symporter [Lentisphaeria bacterium]|nr:sodium:panthothenate symporter [Lentisphaeria bacterium]